jgi:hypothetical protein
MRAPWQPTRLFASGGTGESRIHDADALFRKGEALEAVAVRNEASGDSVRNHVYVQDRAALAQATDLISHFGEHAGMEAASRANHSRSLGNVIHFCRWRQIERAIEMLSGSDVTDTTH